MEQSRARGSRPNIARHPMRKITFEKLFNNLFQRNVAVSNMMRNLNLFTHRFDI